MEVFIDPKYLEWYEQSDIGTAFLFDIDKPVWLTDEPPIFNDGEELVLVYQGHFAARVPKRFISFTHGYVDASDLVDDDGPQ